MKLSSLKKYQNFNIIKTSKTYIMKKNKKFIFIKLTTLKKNQNFNIIKIIKNYIIKRNQNFNIVIKFTKNYIIKIKNLSS